MRRQRRRPGCGSVYPRGRVYWISYSVDGKRQRESSRRTSEREAEQLLAERLALLRPLPGTTDARLFEILGALAADYDIRKKRSVARLRYAVAHLREHFASDPPARLVDVAAIDDYTAARLRAGAGVATVRVELAVLRRAFRLALERGRVARVPAVRMLPRPPARQGFVEDEQLAAILAQLPAHVRAVVHVAAITGWRLASEVLNRRWEHVDFAEGWLRLEPGEGKTGRGREFPFTPELREVLEQQRAAADDLQRRTGRRPSTVFFDQRGQPVGSIRGPWLKAVTAAGCAHLRPHDLRRSAVRRFERAGIAQSVAMKLTGHATASVYNSYAITSGSQLLREAVARLTPSRTRDVHNNASADAVAGSAQPSQSQPEARQ